VLLNGESSLRTRKFFDNRVTLAVLGCAAGSLATATVEARTSVRRTFRRRAADTDGVLAWELAP
jgi:hypothetical protein